MKNIEKIINIIFSIFISLSIMLLCINIVLNFRELYYFDIDYLKITDRVNISKEEMILNYDYLVDYNLGKVDKEFEMPTIKSSKNGKIHFEEVRELFSRVNILLINCLLISIVGINRNIKQRNVKILKYISIDLILMPLTLLSLIFIDFDKTFVLFHEVFFDNDYWVFDSNLDPVIEILPKGFFMHCAVLVLSLILFSSMIVYLIYKKLKKNS
ncbi:MAG: TIGR01906 family membrane protein [Peptostreptococcaceae bacterium]